MNFVVSIVLAAIKALSTFVAGKLVLLSFGTEAFAAHAQLTQVMAVLLPASAGFTSLALMSAFANNDRTQARQIAMLSLLVGITLAASAAAAGAFIGYGRIASFVLGTSQWSYSVLIVPIAICLGCVASMSAASLIGTSHGRSASLLDATMALAGVTTAAIATAHLQIKWLTLSPLVIFGSGALLGTYLVINKRPLLRAMSSPDPAPPTQPLFSYVITGLVASAIAPTAVLAARASIVHHAGIDEAASFIAAQRLAALVTAPVPIYIYSFLSPSLASGNTARVSRRIRSLQICLVAALACGYCVMSVVLPFITPLAFSHEVRVPALLFLVVGAGETARMTAAFQAQHLAVKGHWLKFVGGDVVFVTVFSTAAILGSPDSISMAIAYSTAGVCYLVYMSILGRRGTAYVQSSR